MKEIRAPDKCIDTIRIQVYRCLLYDPKTGLCKNYERRPKICRNTSCIDPDSNESIDDQHKKLITGHFTKMKK